MFINRFILSTLLLTSLPILTADEAVTAAQKEEPIQGDFFIMPGQSTTKENFERWNLSMVASAAMKALDGYDQLPPETQLVRVWMTNDKDSDLFDSEKHSDNWADHGHPLLPRDPQPRMAEYPRRAPQYLSIDDLRKVKEGESIATRFYGAPVELVARQLHYKYRHSGKPFEAMLASEEKSFKEFQQKEAEDERRKQAQRQQQEMLRSESATVASSLKPAFNQRRNQANLPESFLQKMFPGPIQ